MAWKAFGYMAGPGSAMAGAWLTPDYCYVRQPGKCGIIKDRDIGRPHPVPGYGKM